MSKLNYDWYNVGEEVLKYKFYVLFTNNQHISQETCRNYFPAKEIILSFAKEEYISISLHGAALRLHWTPKHRIKNNDLACDHILCTPKNFLSIIKKYGPKPP